MFVLASFLLFFHGSTDNVHHKPERSAASLISPLDLAIFDFEEFVSDDDGLGFSVDLILIGCRTVLVDSRSFVFVGFDSMNETNENQCD